jgi:hypothetical protein
VRGSTGVAERIFWDSVGLVSDGDGFDDMAVLVFEVFEKLFVI